ncbi:MAG: ABC transporter ATP-binding protein [Candidatus Tectomicrobia bacterium]|nr:ABC transporter ATP-binding protein [Candidatus Tectomicrobia bacterium]
MAAHIEVRNLRKVFQFGSSKRGLLALSEVNFAIKPGEFVCILGPSGCGKSTILNILGGLDATYEGEVLVDGVSLSSTPSQKRRIGYIFQEPRLLPWRSVLRNITFALESVGHPRSAARETAQSFINLVGLTGFEHHYPYQLSGGMQQRTSIARAFAVDPDILYMDEPFSSLDEITARSLREELLEIWRKTHKTILFVTHNSMEATFLSDRIFLMTRRPGRIYEEVTVDLPRPRALDDPRLFALNNRIVTNFLSTIGELRGARGA